MFEVAVRSAAIARIAGLGPPAGNSRAGWSAARVPSNAQALTRPSPVSLRKNGSAVVLERQRS